MLLTRRKIYDEMVDDHQLMIAAELERRRTPEGRFDDAAELVRGLALGEEFPTFLTIEAYSRFLVEPEVTAALSAISTGPIPVREGRAA